MVEFVYGQLIKRQNINYAIEKNIFPISLELVKSFNELYYCGDGMAKIYDIK